MRVKGAEPRRCAVQDPQEADREHDRPHALDRRCEAHDQPASGARLRYSGAPSLTRTCAVATRGDSKRWSKSCGFAATNTENVTPVSTAAAAAQMTRLRT